uniref:podocan n=1 Tax=Myxine glutinosa TaxID=7769 RepID=UPI00358E3F65
MADGFVDCVGKKIDTFPSGLPNTIRHLSLQNNMIEEIPPLELSRLAELQTLNLQNNLINSNGLAGDPFKSLSNLEYLYLANNHLTLAPQHLPESLISIDLAANQISRIPAPAFKKKPAIRSLYLHNNKLTDAGIPAGMLESSNKLEILILSSNLLHTVPQGLPSSVYRLHLQNNHLKRLPSGVFDNMNLLRELYLQNNNLTNDKLENKALWGAQHLEFLDLSRNQFVHVPRDLPPSLVVLHLERNHLVRADARGLGRLTALEYLVLNHNHLSTQGLGAAGLRRMKRLHTLHLHSNRLRKVPYGLPQGLRALMLLHNQIHTLRSMDFESCPNVTDLNLSFNILKSNRVHPTAFSSLTNLLNLDLSGNRFTDFPPGLPESLQVVKLEMNRLKAIRDDQLAAFGTLKELHLATNLLSSGSLGPNAWNGLHSLQVLDLSHNSLTEIPAKLPPSLEYLHLENNYINHIPNTAFQQTPKLRGIYMRYNRLRAGSISDEVFEGLILLQVLDFTGNPGWDKEQKEKKSNNEDNESTTEHMHTG